MVLMQDNAFPHQAQRFVSALRPFSCRGASIQNLAVRLMKVMQSERWNQARLRCHDVLLYGPIHHDICPNIIKMSDMTVHVHLRTQLLAG